MRLNDAVGIIISVFMDWKGVLANPRAIRRENTVTWKGFRPIRLEDPVSTNDLNLMVSEGQYTFQIVDDGSLIQLFYSYEEDGDTVNQAMLSYYGYPEVEITDTDDEGIEGSVTEFRAPSRSSLARWLRIDYQPLAARGVLHSDCHLHISSFQNSRFLVSGVPTPKQFVEFVLALCYPSIYEVHRLRKDGSYVDITKARELNVPTIRCPQNDISELMTHVYVPGDRNS